MMFFLFPFRLEAAAQAKWFQKDENGSAEQLFEHSKSSLILPDDS